MMRTAVGLFSLFALFASACGATLPRPAHPITSPALALGSHQTTRARVQSIRAEARVDQRGEGGRVRGTVLMFVQRPDRVRFDVMTQFGPAAILTSDGSEFAFEDQREGRFLTGPTCPQNIARLLNVPLSVEQTTLLLLGGTPVIAHDRAQLRWVDDGFYRITLDVKSGARQEIDFGIDPRDVGAPPERQRLRLRRSEIYDPGNKTRWRAKYDDFKELALGAEPIAMPFEVHIEQPQLDRDTLIRFKQINLNADVPADAFRQTPRPGLPVEVAHCDEQG